MRPIARLSAVALLALLVPGAGGADQPAEKPASDGPRVRLLAPGRAPLRTLRYQATKGQKGELSLGMTMSMEMSIAGQTLPATVMPEMRYGMEYLVTAVEPSGDIRYEFSFKDAKVVPGPNATPAVTEAMRGYMEKMTAMKGHVVVSSRGLVREADFVLPPDLDAQLRQFLDGMRQSLRQISAPFPEEAVGVGAKWETTLRATQNGLTLDQTSVSELTTLEEKGGRLAVTVTQNAEPQQMQPPNLPPGARIDLSTFKSSGSGESVFDLRQLMPSRAEMKLHTEMEATIQMGQEKQPMAMKMDLGITTAGK
jgi:hypothetical protein